MFYRNKKSGGREYLQLVENYREDGKVKQRVLATLGRLDELQASGAIASLAQSSARYCDAVMLLSAHMRGDAPMIECKRVGPALVFDRLWSEIGAKDVIDQLLAGRHFGFPVERAVFLTVVNRLMDPGSDRATMKWLSDYRIEGTDSLELHQMYRTMGWLGEVIDEGDGAQFPRCSKDLIEEGLFAKRSEQAPDLALVLVDTTSTYFYGEGGETLGQRGYSRDNRPDLKQMVVAFIVDLKGNPICCELWPGNTVDSKSLVPIVDRMRKRFQIKEICVVADRGMCNKETIASLEERGWSYILGSRMRSQNEVKEDVLSRGGRYSEIYPEGANRDQPAPLKCKEVWVDDRRYIICLNEDQRRKDEHDRRAILQSLSQKLRQGSKGLIGNNGYRKYVRKNEAKFEIDQDAVQAEARFDGKWVLRTNTTIAAAVVALRYKRLWMVEDLFRSLKHVVTLRPVFHKCDETIRGHVFCSFLALVLRKALLDRLEAAGHTFEWADVVRALDGLTETDIEHENKRFRLRSQPSTICTAILAAVKVAQPPTLRQLPAEGVSG